MHEGERLPAKAGLECGDSGEWMLGVDDDFVSIFHVFARSNAPEIVDVIAAQEGLANGCPLE